MRKDIYFERRKVMKQLVAKHKFQNPKLQIEMPLAKAERQWIRYEDEIEVDKIICKDIILLSYSLYLITMEQYIIKFEFFPY